MRSLISRLIADERGATVVEYGLICSLVFLIAMGAMSAFGRTASNKLITAANAISGAVR